MGWSRYYEYVFNVFFECDLGAVLTTRFGKHYEHLFKANAPPAPPAKPSASSGAQAQHGHAHSHASRRQAVPSWSHYLQSKVVRARERIEAEAKIGAEGAEGAAAKEGAEPP